MTPISTPLTLQPQCPAPGAQPQCPAPGAQIAAGGPVIAAMPAHAAQAAEASAPAPAPEACEVKIDPEAYCQQVQMVLEPDQFRELKQELSLLILDDMQRLNAGQQSVNETLENVREIFGKDNPLLFAAYKQNLIQQETQYGQQQQLQQQPLTPMAPISTPLTLHPSSDGGSDYSILLAQEARKLDTLKKVNETRKRNQKKEIKRETKIATHASTLSSALAKVKDDGTSEKSIEMPDRKIQPSKCGICKDTFMSRNALFKHLDDTHEVIREWKQRPEVAEEKISPRACDASHTNQRPAADTWQIQPKGRSSSVKSKPSNARASKTIIQPHVNIFASLYEQDEDQDEAEAAIAPAFPRYICPEAAPMRIVGTAVVHSDTIQRISAHHNIFI